MRIFHIATVADWNASSTSADYRVSTLGKSLADVGYIHAARREQVAGVFSQFYAAHRGPLVLLAIETGRLSSPWREEQVGDETFPHIHGPLNRSAVVDVQPLNSRGGTVSMLQLAVGEMFRRITAAMGVMLLAVLGVQLGNQTNSDWGPFLGGVAGLALGALIWFLISRQLSRRAAAGLPG